MSELFTLSTTVSYWDVDRDQRLTLGRGRRRLRASAGHRRPTATANEGREQQGNDGRAGGGHSLRQTTSTLLFRASSHLKPPSIHENTP